MSRASSASAARAARRPGVQGDAGAADRDTEAHGFDRRLGQRRALCRAERDITLM